ncbi:hypothetical protein [Paenibacillus sp. CAA11]|uniref:hypothetical protein n=1 Tax=Paenibacillus sp. CAA11 TaxID=1532905 RepID=UPI00131F0835|nr:hypothetical protein [Paenibacillus sp. CAA11]
MKEQQTGTELAMTKEQQRDIAEHQHMIKELKRTGLFFFGTTVLLVILYFVMESF